MSDRPLQSAPSGGRSPDPETLVLRGRPRPVVRLKRSVVIGTSALLSTALIAVAWSAFEPPSFKTGAGEGAARPFERPPSDVLAKAPRDYGEVPKLGPPLPGDLGRPILERQRELAGEPMTSGGLSTPERRREEAERLQRLSRAEAASASPLLFQRTGRQDAAERAAPQPSGGRSEPWDPAQARVTISAGTIIPASLLTGLDSDLPGVVLAQVTEGVRDSATGRVVVIPQGARLLGRYDSQVGYGQSRAAVVWQRLMFPDGSWAPLGDAPATDASGFSGLSDKVDRHTGELLKGVLLSSLLGVAGELSFGAEGGFERAFRRSAQEVGSNAGDKIVSRGLDVQPTIRVRPGWPVRVILSEDLHLKPWKG